MARQKRVDSDRSLPETPPVTRSGLCSPIDQILVFSGYSLSRLSNFTRASHLAMDHSSGEHLLTDTNKGGINESQSVTISDQGCPRSRNMSIVLVLSLVLNVLMLSLLSLILLGVSSQDCPSSIITEHGGVSLNSGPRGEASFCKPPS